MGQKRGVRFVYSMGSKKYSVRLRQCISEQGYYAVHPDTVEVRLVDGGKRAFNGVGWKPKKGINYEPLRMVLFYDPGPNDTPEKVEENFYTMTHEIGSYYAGGRHTASS